MRTLQDWINEDKAGPFESRISYPDGSPVPHFACRCGRVVPAYMMLDLAPENAPGVSEDELLLLADAQTSGGLLVAGEVPGYPVIGELTPARPGVTVVVR